MSNFALKVPTFIRYTSLNVHLVPLLSSRPTEWMPDETPLFTSGYMVPIHGQWLSSSSSCCTIFTTIFVSFTCKYYYP